MEILENFNLNDIEGFQSAGISAGIKKNGKKDLGLLYSEFPAVGAAVFTQNKVKAAPVLLDMEHIKNNHIQAIIINSGNANAATGETGMIHAKKMAEDVAKYLKLATKEVLVESTGVIGQQLDIKKISIGIEKICSQLSKKNGNDLVESIMTTDTFEKKIAVEIEISGKKVQIAGIAKGSGMIHPNMATMLSVLASNVCIEKEILQTALKETVNNSYNMISVDGDTSTNDMSAILCNGTANNEKIISIESEAYQIFKKALQYVNIELAKLIAKDGEGATKLIEVICKNSSTKIIAQKIAKSVVSSNLFKAAVFGNDANWGRILCATGYADVELDTNKIDIYLSNGTTQEQVAENGMGLNFSEEIATNILKCDKVIVIIDLKDGVHTATAWGCDLTYDYVKINADYRS